MTTFFVGAGQTLSGVTLGSGDAELVWPGGTAAGTIINGGYQDDAGTASNTTINGGYQFVEAGGTATSTAIYGGGQLVMAGGTANSATINGGYQDDFGTAIGTTINRNGIEIVEQGGIASAAIINGGTQYVYAGGTAKNTTITGGLQFVEFGGAASSTMVYGGDQLVMSGATAISATISGGYQDDYGTAIGTTINTSGVQIVEGGGTASRTTLNGGMQMVDSGGTATGTTLNAGVQFLEFGGAASNTTVNGGEQLIESGAVATGTSVNGGEEDDFGTATGTTINSIGVEIVEGGGIATGTIVNGGVQYVYAGGTARNTTINGGTEYVYGGGTANGVIFGGPAGVLQLQQPGSLVGTISGWQIGDTIDFLNGTLTSAVINGATLQVTLSGKNFSYQLAGQQVGTVVQIDHGTELRLVSKPPPAVTEALAHDTAISSTDKITSDPALTGSGDPNTIVHFTIDGTPIAATVTADAKGFWSYTPSGLADGVHTIMASQTDAAGNTGTASLIFRLDTDKAIAPSLLVDGGGAPTVNVAQSHSVSFVIAGLDDETGTATFSDGHTSVAVAVSGNGYYAVDLSTLADGPISSTLTVGDPAGNSFSANGNPVALDTDKNVAPSLLVNGGGAPTVNAAQSHSASFVIAGLDDETGTASFSDGHTSVAVAVSGNGYYAVDLSTLADGPISSTLTVGDPAGNSFSANGNPVALDTDKNVAPVLFVNGGRPMIGIVHDSAVVFTVSGLDDETGTATFSDGSHSVVVAVGGNGAFTANLSALNPGTITSTLTVGDTAGNSFSATGHPLTIDPGPTAGTGVTTVGHNQTVDLTNLVNGLVAPGISGDSEKLVNVGAARGAASLSAGLVTYTAPTSGPDTLSYTVTDQYGDTASGVVGITIDPGPSASTGAITVGHDQTVDLTAVIQGLIAPGIAGDTETVTAVSTAHGTASVSNGAIIYSAPSTGLDALNYTVTDQYGDSAGGTINVTVDPGPTARAASIMVAAGATTDLTAYLLGLDKPGIAADTLTLSGDSTAGTKGTVTLANGLLTYAAPASAASDGFGYTVADQYGDTASALVTISAVTIGNIGNSSGTVVLGDNSTSVGFGRGTITVVAGNGSDTIAGGTANDTVIAGNGNDTVTLGQGNNTVILGSGNDSVTVGDGNNTITIAGSATSTDTIKAGGGNNTLYLGAGHETVSLGGGNNTLILTTGTYDVSAGHGTNLFEFTGSQALLNLSIASNDELVFRATGFDLGVDNGLGTGTPQPIAASLFSSHTDGTFATPDNRFAYDAATGKLYYDAQGSTPASTSVVVADLTNHPHLGASSLFFTN